MNDEPLPEIPSWRLQGAADALQEAIEMNNTQAIDMGILVVDYLQSGEFFLLICLIMLYRLVAPIIRLAIDHARARQ